MLLLIFEILHNEASRKEVEANAKLIAAAPDLLGALELMIIEFDDTNGSKAVLDRAKKAIKKATE